MSVRTLVLEWIEYLIHERGLAKNTVKMYRSWSGYYLNWCDEQGFADTLEERLKNANLRAYVLHQSKRGLRPRSIRNCIMPLRQLCTYCLDQGHLTESPIGTIKLPKKDPVVRPTVTAEQLQSIINAASRQRSVAAAARDAAMISAIIMTGVRFQELLDMKVGDVNLADGGILIQHGKGNKSRAIWPPQDCMDAIRRWLEVRDKNCKHDWLWAYDIGRRVGVSAFREIWEDTRIRAGVETRIRPHDCRHAFAARMLKSGATIREIQASLGHSQMSTTFVYLAMGDEPAKAMQEFGALTSPALQEPQSPKSVPQPERTSVPQKSHPEEIKVKRTRAFFRLRRAG